MKKAWLAVLMVALVVCPGIGRAQFPANQTPINQINPNREPDDLDSRGGGDSSFNRELQQRQIKRLRELHHHEVISDTARMEQLAAAMKDEVDKGNKTLNADVMKDADEIARLAKRVSERIKKPVKLGVDIGGTKTAVVVSAALPEVQGRVEFATEPARGPQYAIDRIVDAGRNLLAGAAPDSIGVSCGSPLDRVRGVIQAPPNLTTWIDVPICRLLQEAFHAPCRLENDANAGAVAEHRYGAGVGADHMIFLTLGTGLGAGIAAAGKLYLGANGDAGEIGHVRLSARGPVGYHKAGSIEGWSSGGGIAQLARKANRPGLVTARDVGIAAQAGDAVALKILRQSGERLGQALAMLVDVLNPQRIVLGGLAWRMGENLLAPMRRVLEREALPQTLRACEIVPAALAEKIGDIAALCVADGLEDS